MPDRETVAQLKTLRDQFTHNAQKEYPQVILPDKRQNGALTAQYFSTLAERIGSALTSIDSNNLKAALEQLQAAGYDLNSRSERQRLNAEQCRRFSDDRSLLASQSEDLKAYYDRLSKIIWRVAYDDKAAAEKNAASSPAALLRLAEVLKNDISFHSHYGNIVDIQEILVLSAQHQIRQEETIRQLAERLEKLEKQLEEQPAPMLEKQRHSLPSRPPQP